MDYAHEENESVCRKTNQEAHDTELQSLENSHSWLSQTANQDEDTIDEVIRYTLDELRLA